ncbi:MAG: diguanylate cyclase [Lachnospiraceae bacterium]|nr:diguanylate cyclase [Lachnospiraceae bacterium]
MKGHKLRLFRIINAVIITVIILFVLVVSFVIKDDWVTPQIDYTIDLEDGWTLIHSDGSEEEVSGRFSIGQSDPVTFYRTLPEEVDDDQILRIKCPYTTVDAYIDGKLIYHAGEAKLGPITTTVGNVFALIPLNREYGGKQIYITVEPRHYGYEVLIKDAAITSMSYYTLSRINMNVPYLILCMILVIISIVSIVLFVTFRISPISAEKDFAKGFFHLALLGVFATTWILSDFHIIGMVEGTMTRSGIYNYLGFMLCPFMFAGVLLNSFEDNLYFKIMFAASEVNFVVQMLLFLLGIMDLPKGLMITQALMVMLIIGMVYFGILMLKDYKDKKERFIIIPTIGFVVFSIWAVISYLLNGDWMMRVALAITCFEITIISNLLMNLWEALKRNLELERVKKIAYLDKMTELENRRSYDEYIAQLTEKDIHDPNYQNLRFIMLDINGLKRTNDIFGHMAGDELIIGTADCVKKAFNGIGRSFRTGGDEFVIITTEEHEVISEARKHLKECFQKWRGETIEKLSVSMGRADRMENPDATVETLVALADKRMYEDKQKYYASQLSAELDIDENETNGDKIHRRLRYSDSFTLSKYTMPIIQQMAEVIPGGFFIYREDDKRELLYQNNHVLSIFGCETVEEFKELTGYTFEGMVYPEDFKTIQSSIDNQIDDQDGNGMDHVLYRILRKDGAIRWIDDYGHYSHSEDFGDIYYVFITDVTESYDTLVRNN